MSGRDANHRKVYCEVRGPIIVAFFCGRPMPFVVTTAATPFKWEGKWSA